MKRILAIFAVVGAFAAIPAVASADGGSHSCGVGGGGYVTASDNTSCGFANNIVHQWVRGRCWAYHHCRGTTYSPATGRDYTVVCTQWGHYPVHAFCRSNGFNSWIRFVDHNR